MLLRAPAEGFGWRVVTSAWLVGVVLGACSRSPLRNTEVEEAPYVCQINEDCRSTNACERRICDFGLCRLLSTISCDDGNPCTNDICNPKDASCSNPWITPDDDNDGYRAMLPGKTLSDLDACGDDCNDASPLSHPGAREVCDGVDNDCNGVVDDEYRYYGEDSKIPEAVLVSNTSKHEAIPAGLSYDGNRFAMTTIERNNRWQGIFHAISQTGEIEINAAPLTQPVSDGLAGPLVWTGSVYGTVWEDRRVRSYDLYFNRLDINGRKMHADVRLTWSAGFSIQPSLVYDGNEWLLAYADDSDTRSFSIYAQRISKDAEVVGEPQALTPWMIDAWQPRLSKNSDGFGLFYYSKTDDSVMYLALDAQLQPELEAVPIDYVDADDASIRWNGDRYIIAWATKTSTVGDSIWAMAVDSRGQRIVAPRPITAGAGMARSPSIVGMGNRFVLLWADDRFTPDSFELSMQTFDNSLRAIDGQQRISKLQSNSIDPVGVLGGGSLGILFRSSQLGVWNCYFMTLGCWNVALE